MKNSSALSRIQVLAPRDAKKFLSEFVNLREEPEAGKKFITRYAGSWPVPGRITASLIAENIDRAPGAKPEKEQINDFLHRHWLLPLRDSLRNVWEVPDTRTKFWGALRILDEDLFSEIPGHFFPAWKRPGNAVPLPPPTLFEQALQYLCRPDVNTGVCANSGCPAPYFFPSRSNQKYCSQVCALPAQRGSKQRWWAQNGSRWRRQSRKRRTRKKH